MVLRIALHGQDMKERIGALKVLLAFCIANTEGQQALVASISLQTTKGRPQPGLSAGLPFLAVQRLGYTGVYCLQGQRPHCHYS